MTEKSELSGSRRLIYFYGAGLCLLLMAGILVFFRKTGWIRGTAGDFIVVVFLYFLLRGIFLLSPVHSFFISLAVSFSVEGLQYLKLLETLHLSHLKFARIIFGSVYDPLDLLAYASGGTFALLLDRRFLSSENRKK